MAPSPRVWSWVVYQTPRAGKTDGLKAVCSQAEWDAMEAARPGYHTLVRAGIRSEGEAEWLARGTSGDPIPKGDRAPRRPDPVTPGGAEAAYTT